MAHSGSIYRSGRYGAVISEDIDSRKMAVEDITLHKFWFSKTEEIFVQCVRMLIMRRGALDPDVYY